MSFQKYDHELREGIIDGNHFLSGSSYLNERHREKGDLDDTSQDDVDASSKVQLQDNSLHFERGVLLVWGCGEFGQHGHGHTEDVPNRDALGCPLWLGQDRMVVEVACGSSHTLALTDDNKIYSWGNGNSGQLGIGTQESSPQPRPMNLGVSSGTKLKGITCGTRHSFVWTEDGDCFSFGNNYSGQLGYDFRRPDYKENQLRPVFVDTLLHQTVSQVACGARHSVFLFTSGKVAAVGTNNRGQIGCGDTTDAICPKALVDLCDVSVIACGNSHSLAGDDHGRVYVWGYSKASGSKADVLMPHCVYSGEDGIRVKDIAGGDSHSVFLLSNGVLYSWGNNFEGQLGHGKTVKFLAKPKPIESHLLPGNVTSISVGENTSAAINADGDLYLWGKNSSQVIRDDENSRFFQFEPCHVPLGMWKASKVSCGSWHIACIANDGQVHKANEVHKDNSIIDSREMKYGSYEGPSNGHKEQLETESYGGNEKNFLPPVDLQCLSTAVPCETKGASLNTDSTKICLNDVSTYATENNQDEKPSIGLDENEFDFLNNDEKSSSMHISNFVPDEVTYSDTTNTKKPFFHLSNQDENKKCSRKLITAFDKEDKWSIFPNGNRSDGSDTEHINKCAKNMGLVVLQDKKQQKVEDLVKENRECEKGTQEEPNSCSSMQSDEFDFNISSITLDQKLNLKELKFDSKYGRLETEEKSAVLSSCRRRSQSELLTSTDNNVSPQTVRSSLHSASLSSLSCYKEDDATCARQHSLTLGSQRVKGHLNREKKPARMLRRTFCNVEYYLPNQVVHTVDINVSQAQKQYLPHPPMHRTQSSPSLYSSNLLRSPHGARKTSSGSLQSPRPPTSSMGTSGDLPPKPPVWNRSKRFLENNIMFSSGASWRKRK